MFYTTIFISICFGVLSTCRPLLIQYAFDNYIMENNLTGLTQIIFVLFILLLFEAYFQYIFIYRSNYLAQKIIQDLRVEVFGKIINFHVTYFDKTPTGQLITRVISDIESIASIFSQGLLVVFGDLFKMCLIICCMFLVSWELTLISLMFLPFLIFATIIFQKYMRIAFLDVRKYISRINVFVFEHLIGMDIVQSFAQENTTLMNFKKLNSLHRGAHIKTILYFSIFLPIVDVFSAIAMGLVVWYGTFNILSDGSITVGQIVAFILFINMLFRPLRAIADRFNILQMGLVAAARVFDVINQKIKQDVNPVSTRNKSKILVGKIKFENVCFSYKKNEPVLRDLSFEIPKNNTLAIIGPTGSGKTTIINLIMKWYDVHAGNISINNQNLNTIDLNILRQGVGVVLQNSFFLQDTLLNNIKFFNNISDDAVYRAVQEVGLEDFINKFPNKYNYHIGARGMGLSEGEKQLVSFLRTYLLNPPYLILDEATSSMDPITEKLIQNAIKKITKNRTSIIIAHRLSTIQYADKILVLEKGQLIETGTHSELIDLNGRYAHYYHQQFISH